MIEIRLARRDELRDLFAAALVVFGGTSGWDDRRVVEILRDDLVFVATEDGTPAGYVALTRDPGGSVVIEQILVAPGHERHGVGRRLLSWAEGYAISERSPSLWVVVERDNKRARSLYRRAGFQPAGAELLELILPRTPASTSS
jgi:ribosomal protein S18 acetylase RimI-like enzyme